MPARLPLHQSQSLAAAAGGAVGSRARASASDRGFAQDASDGARTAPDEAVASMARQAQKDSRDSARATITRAANRTVAAWVAVEAAVAALQTAQKEEREAQRQLAALEVASSVNPVEPVAGLAGAFRALLSALESTPLVHAVTNQVPDRLVDHMQAINAALSACPSSLSGSTSTSPGVLGSESSDEETMR